LIKKTNPADERQGLFLGKVNKNTGEDIPAETE
jgi:hypothetical protein